jgi:hypothetical protein
VEERKVSKLMSKGWSRFSDGYYRLGALIVFWLMSVPSFADIPAAPSVPGASGNGDFMKTGQGVFNEGAGIAITILYVVAILIYSGSLLWLLVQAKQSKEWGNFFKGAGIGLAVLVLVLILLNQAKSALS